MIAFGLVVFPNPFRDYIITAALDITPEAEPENEFPDQQTRRLHGVAPLPFITFFLQEYPGYGACVFAGNRVSDELPEIVRRYFHIVVTEEYPGRFSPSDTDITLDANRLFR
jgi:hypothetical protein